MKNFFGLLFMLIFFNLSAQSLYNGNGFYNSDRFIDEFEISIGYLNVQGDFGVRNKFDTTLGSSGMTLGFKGYLNLDNSGKYLSRHLKYNVAGDVGFSGLAHRRYPNPNNNPNVDKVLAVKGQFVYFDMGVNFEYHISDLKNPSYFNDSFFNNFDPYLGGGIYGVYYNVKLESDLGNYEIDPTILPDSYVGRIHNGSGLTYGLHLETGLRYRMSEQLLLNLKSEWLYFPKDDIDGLVPDPRLVTNLYNDWLFKTQLGIVVFVQ